MSEPRPTEQASTGQLISQASEDISTLIRTELALAKDDLASSGKRLGVGAGLFGTAGTLALFGLGALVATAILALALVVDAWLAALIVAAVLFVAAGIAALVGKSSVSKVTQAPQRRVESVQQDVAAVKEHDTKGNA